jgi:hypothetical protein
MRRIVWLALLLVSLVSCNFSPQSSDVSVDQKPVINMTVNGKSVNEFVQDTSVELLQSFSKVDLMDFGSILTPEQLASLPAEKQNLLKADASYQPFEVRYASTPEDVAGNEPFIYKLDGKRVSPYEFLKSLSESDFEQFNSWDDTEKQWLRGQLLNDEITSLPVAIQNRLK